MSAANRGAFLRRMEEAARTGEVAGAIDCPSDFSRTDVCGAEMHFTHINKTF